MSVTPLAKRRTAPRRSAGAQPRAASAIGGERDVEVHGDGGRRQHVRQVGAAEQRDVERHAAGGRRHVGAHAVEGAVAHGDGAHGGIGRLAERQAPARKRADARHHARVVRVGDEHGRRRSRLPGSRPWRRRWRRARRRSPGGRRPRWSTRRHRAGQCRPACGSRRRGSCPVPSPPHPARCAAASATAAARCDCSSCPCSSRR